MVVNNSKDWVLRTKVVLEHVIIGKSYKDISEEYNVEIKNIERWVEEAIKSGIKTIALKHKATLLSIAKESHKMSHELRNDFFRIRQEFYHIENIMEEAKIERVKALQSKEYLLNTELIRILQVICNSACELLSKVHGSNVDVCIKIITQGDSNLNNAYAKIACNRYEEGLSEDLFEIKSVDKDRELKDIYNKGWRFSQGKTKIGRTTREYLTVPIRIDKNFIECSSNTAETNNNYDVLGFVSVYSKNQPVKMGEVELHFLMAISDHLYKILDRYIHYLDKIYRIK